MLDRLRAVLRSYGPTGSATGWRLWIDGWALAQHEPVIAAHFRQSGGAQPSNPEGTGGRRAREGSISCPDPDASVSRLLALLDGLSVAAEVFGSVSRAQLRRWLDGAIAAEFGSPPVDARARLLIRESVVGMIGAP